MKEALYWNKLEDNKLQCLLCPKKCEIIENKTGFCGIRQNISGTLYATQYGKSSGLQMDPVEKKPLYHFYPTQYILSVGSIGCNFRCQFCQNWHLIEKKSAVQDITSLEIVNLAKENNSFGIAYTYNEPFINFEFVLDTAKLAREKGLKNVLVTNGFYSPKAWNELMPYIDALNIDLKYINKDRYKKISYGELEPVQATIKSAHGNCHVEITNLIVPTLNDSKEDLEGLVNFIAGVSDEIPVHFSRYHPSYKCSLPPTPVETMRLAYEIASKKLKYIYIGNIVLPEGNNTYCPNCHNLIIGRTGYYVQIAGLTKQDNTNKCSKCGNALNIIS